MSLVMAPLPLSTGSPPEATAVPTAQELQNRKAGADEPKKVRNGPKRIYDAPRPPGARQQAAARSEGLEKPGHSR